MKTSLEQCVWYLPAQREKPNNSNFKDVGCYDCDGNNTHCDRYSKADGYLLSKLNKNLPSRIKEARASSYEDEARGMFY